MYANALRRTVFTLIGLVAASTASAGTITTWLGTSGTSWSTAANWTTGTAPTTSGTFSMFFGGNTASGTAANNVGNVTLDALTFSNNGTAGRTQAFRITSGTLSLTDGAVITAASSSGAAIGDTIASAVRLSGSSTFDLGTKHNLTLSAVSGSGSILKTGAGNLAFGGVTTGISGLNVANGTVQFGVNSLSSVNSGQVAMGTGTTSGGVIINNVTGTSGVSFLLNGTSSVTANTSGVIRFSNADFNSASSTSAPTLLTLTNSSLSGAAVIDGVIRDNSPGQVSVSVTGSNAWVLNGVNTYTGTTSVSSAAALLMNGVVNASSTTTSSGYLGGSGTFGGAVSILSGTLSPGGTATSTRTITDSIGKLTVGSLSLSNPATTVMTITGSTAGLFDQIEVSGGSGSMNYGGILALTMSGSYVDQTSFGLFSGIVNPLGDLSDITLSADGSPYAGLDFSDYDNTSVQDRTDFNMVAGDWITGWNSSNQRLLFSQSTGTLTVVPEPSTIVFAGIGLVMFGWSTWTRRRARARRQVIEAAIA